MSKDGWGWATCPTDGEPLISTFEQRGKEFHCLGCGQWWEFLQPIGVHDQDRPGIAERHAELKALFAAGTRGPIEVRA